MCGQHTTVAMLRIKDNMGDTPAMVAVRRGRTDSVKMLDTLEGIAREDEKTLSGAGKEVRAPGCVGISTGEEEKCSNTGRDCSTHCSRML